MCKYRNENKGVNRDNTKCEYPNFYSKHREKFKEDLIIDEDGYCLFHSEKNKWKKDNDFKGRLLNDLPF